jgi:predicted RNase H-like nuclease (RuvC/YqgF family)
VRPFGAKRSKRTRAARGDGDGWVPLEDAPRKVRRRRDHSEDEDVEQLRAALREHAREAERQKDAWALELDVLKQSLRRRIQEVAAREQELRDAVQRLERRRGDRGRRGRRSGSDANEREAELDQRARELDALAKELARRERDLERSERRLAARGETS